VVHADPARLLPGVTFAETPATDRAAMAAACSAKKRAS
jgi:hypothetical protein